MTVVLEPPREGLLLPGFQLPRSGGGTVRIRAYRGRRALALIFVHDAGCPDCRAYVRGALELYAEYGEEGGEVVVIVPSTEASVDAMRHDFALPFPVLIDEAGTVFRRYALRAGHDAAVMITDRFGVPRIWQPAGVDHALLDHESLIAELRYLALTCSGGCSVPIWSD